jgi:hypothetical protein
MKLRGWIVCRSSRLPGWPTDGVVWLAERDACHAANALAQRSEVGFDVHPYYGRQRNGTPLTSPVDAGRIVEALPTSHDWSTC